MADPIPQEQPDCPVQQPASAPPPPPAAPVLAPLKCLRAFWSWLKRDDNADAFGAVSEGIGALSGTFAALVTIGTVIFAWWTIRDNDETAKHAREQQQTIFQATVASTLTQEYFTLRRDAVMDLRNQSTNPAGTDYAEYLYANRMYGLHFEEYHLFRLHAIPAHLYTSWLVALSWEVNEPNTNDLVVLPKLGPDFRNKVARTQDEDFRNFMAAVLDTNFPPDNLTPYISKLVQMESTNELLQ